MRPVAIITGGTRGIGLGIAEALAAEGFRLAVTGRRDRKDISDVLDRLSHASEADVFYSAGDLGERADRLRLVEELKSEFDAVHCLVNNAGMGAVERVDVLETDEDNFERVVRTNMQAAHFLTRDVAKWMLGNSDGLFRSVVNITSVSAEAVSLNRAEYCIAKASLRMSTQIFAARLAPEGIGVYEVAPGVIETDMTAGVKDKYDAAIEGGLIPAARWGTPADVGAAVAGCAAGRLPYASGTCLRVDGGLTIPRL